MTEKTYTQGPVTYGYVKRYRKWAFNTPTVVRLEACKGQEVAHKVAKVIAGSFKRSGKLDNLARANISKLVNSRLVEENN